MFQLDAADFKLDTAGLANAERHRLHQRPYSSIIHGLRHRFEKKALKDTSSTGSQIKSQSEPLPPSSASHPLPDPLAGPCLCTPFCMSCRLAYGLTGKKRETYKAAGEHKKTKQGCWQSLWQQCQLSHLGSMGSRGVGMTLAFGSSCNTPAERSA